ncbi:hypothetical protein [Roseovarius sp. ZX-A-9]|uniref:hypothetical protein n=1 Tax=Roseovarius sp. ZX-A-9 TaxID=3014783 RepID=UPI00232E63E6|nr:hypothetical protein [Roseovarius sp. ZX-A-9]
MKGFAMIRLFSTCKERRDRKLKTLPHDLPPHIMRDIGLTPWPERQRLPFQPLW